MRTIVINTSVEAKKTQLNILFKAPFDQSSLIWFDEDKFCNIANYPAIIERELIDNADTVDRNYNLLVLVDLYGLYRSQEKEVSAIYKVLLTKYLSAFLIDPLKANHDLRPNQAAIFFVDSFKYSKTEIEYSAANPEEAEENERKRILEAEKKNRSVARSDDGDLIGDDITTQSNGKKRSKTEKNILDIFSWTEDSKADDILWNKTKLDSLDFSSIFSETDKAIKASAKNVHVIDIALAAVTELINNWNKNGEHSSVREFDISSHIVNSFSISAFAFDIVTENEQSLLEGYFNVLANIFTCVQEQTVLNNIKNYSKDEIKKVLLEALRKYTYFSKEENITIELEPVIELYNAKKCIYEERKKTAHAESPAKNIDELLKPDSSEKRLRSEDVLPIFKPTKTDKRFGDIAADIFNNYDPEIIKSQNDSVIKDCLKGFWNWRDKQTDDDFVNVAEACRQKQNLTDNAKGQNPAVSSTSDTRAEMVMVEEDFDREYTELINKVTEAEHKLSSNENILLETKNLIIKYVDTAKKGKIYLLAQIGAGIAVLISILPFLFIQGASANENLLHKIMYVLFTAGFAVLYGGAVSFYSSLIMRKKRTLISELETYKEQSEKERRESIEALYEYYRDVIVDAESHYLLRREISKRNDRNSRKLMMKNNHIVRLDHLERRVKRFITTLKLDFSENDLDDESKNNFDESGLSLYGEKSYYDKDNQKIYSVLDLNTSDNNGKEENV